MDRPRKLGRQEKIGNNTGTTGYGGGSVETVVRVPVVAVISMEMEQATRAMEVNVVLVLSMVELEVHLALVVL